LRIPADCKSTIQVCFARRQGKTLFAASDNENVCRIVFHFGQDDVYKLTEVFGKGRYGDSKEFAMVNGACLLLDPDQFAFRTVYVSPNPKISFPSVLPDDFEAIAQKQISKMSAGMGKNAKISKTVDRARAEQLSKRTSIRPRSYNRLSIVMDFEKSEYLKSEKVLDIARSLNSPCAPGEFPNRLPTDIPEHIKASIPGGIASKLYDGMSGKLNDTVSSIGNNVLNDVKDRHDITGPIENMRADFISDVTSSVIRNVDMKDVAKLAPDIENLVKDVDVNELPFNKDTKDIIRRHKRRERKARYKANRRRRQMDDDNMPGTGTNKDVNDGKSPMAAMESEFLDIEL
jgi:hypothetical protein